jgi:hypothetical protein
MEAPVHSASGPVISAWVGSGWMVVLAKAVQPLASVMVTW